MAEDSYCVLTRDRFLGTNCWTDGGYAFLMSDTFGPDEDGYRDRRIRVPSGVPVFNALRYAEMLAGFRTAGWSTYGGASVMSREAFERLYPGAAEAPKALSVIIAAAGRGLLQGAPPVEDMAEAASRLRKGPVVRAVRRFDLEAFWLACVDLAEAAGVGGAAILKAGAALSGVSDGSGFLEALYRHAVLSDATLPWADRAERVEALPYLTDRETAFGLFAFDASDAELRRGGYESAERLLGDAGEAAAEAARICFSLPGVNGLSLAVKLMADAA